jgi:urease accessory protein UreF
MQASREVTLDEINCFTPLIDLASMRHPLLETRLFIS